MKALLRRMGASGASLAVVIALGAWSAVAQESSDKAGAPVAKRTYDPTRRVPDYFGQIGLTPEQKESIYKIRAKHLKEVDALEKQIDAIQARMLADCEAILTDTQKQILDHRRRAAANPEKKASEPDKAAGKAAH